MTDTTESVTRPWSRPTPARASPQRNAGGLYRTAEGGDESLRGVPLNSANAAVVAAVRLAYQVAEAQIERSTRLARRLRDAGDKQVGPHSDKKALDGAERLVQNAFMSGLEWWEGSVAEGRCPVKRIAAAEYQMIGTLLGFGPPEHGRKSSAAAPASPSTPERATTKGVDRKAETARRQLKVVHKGEKKNRRPVVIEAWSIAVAGALQAVVYFYCAANSEAEPIEAELTVSADNKDIRLSIATPPRAPSGLWKCAVCDSDDVQVGQIDISL